jgi:3-hydroxypropanoate dehydrogenase
MKNGLGVDALNEIFREARTHSAWLDKPVSDEILRELYDLMKWGPPSANGSPGDFSFCALRKRRAPATGAGSGERGKDDYCAGHGDHRLRSAVF